MRQLLAPCFLLLAACAPLHAADDHPSARADTHIWKLAPNTYLQALDNVNLRVDPSPDATVIEVIAQGELISVNTGDVSQDWMEVRYQDAQGWVYLPNVTVLACAELVQAAPTIAKAFAQCPNDKAAALANLNRASCESLLGNCSFDDSEDLWVVGSCESRDGMVPVCQSSADEASALKGLETCLPPLSESCAGHLFPN